MVCAATEGLGGVAAGTLKRQWDQRMIDGEERPLFPCGAGNLGIFRRQRIREFKNWPKAERERNSSVLGFSAVWVLSTPRESIGSERLR